MTKPVLHGRDHAPGGADPIPGLGSQYVLVDGIVAASGDIIRGTGFTVELSDTNLFTITFDEDMPDYAAVTLAPVGGTDPATSVNAVLEDYDSGGFTVRTFDANGDPDPLAFHFHATCPTTT